MDHAQGKLIVPLGALALSCILLLGGFWLFGQRSAEPAQELLLPATTTLQMLASSDMPAPIENLQRNGRVYALRQAASHESIEPALLQAMQFIADAPLIAQTAIASGLDREMPRAPYPLFVPNGSASAGLIAFAPPEFGESHDSSGRPIRWSVPEHLLALYNKPRPQPFQMPEQRAINPDFARALAKLAPSRSAGSYRPLVDSLARRYGLNTDLVMAIIHSESNFSPALVSSKSAMGLMQLLPSTASGEVHRFLYGTPGRVSFEQLSVPEINIRYGTAYLHILESRYFAGVRDRHVREACVIAAYNMGPNGFLRLYGATPEQAVARINSMGQDEFLADLQRRLPMRETRFYVEKVRRMKEHYSSAH